MNAMSSLRLIPSVDELLQRPRLRSAADVWGRDAISTTVRDVAADLRSRIGGGGHGLPATGDGLADWIEEQVMLAVASRHRASLRPVINATGVIVHTNLGRAPLSRDALERAARIATGYSNLEYDLDAGSRGHRHVHAERLLSALTGAEAALVTNNNAAAVLVAVAALAAGREVLVSRGELVEIGGGFRVPEILAQSGASLREVGTTNRTRVADYAASIGPTTAALLRVHPSNFVIQGFTERPRAVDLAALAHQFDLPLIEDLGSGWLGVGAGDIPGLSAEPSVIDSLRAGVDLVAFSGDKLLGGPQAGILVGRRRAIDSVSRHPLMRAVRADKLTYAVLEATLDLWCQPSRRVDIPVYRLIATDAAELAGRARTLAARLATCPLLRVRTVAGESVIGGGSAPGLSLPTTLVVVTVAERSASALEAALRTGEPPVVARVADDELLLDLRTVFEEEEATLAEAIEAAARGVTGSGVSESS